MAQRFDAQDDYNPLGEHVVEIPARDHTLHPAARRSYATLGVAAFLAIAGIGITVGLISERSRHAQDEAAQREELRVGWQMLGTLAANGVARDTTTDAVNAPLAAPLPAAAPHVVIVSVPAQAVPAQAVPAQPVAPQTTPVASAASNGAVPAQAVPGASIITQPLVAGAVPTALPAQSSANGATQASPTAQSLPVDGVLASPPTQSLPSDSKPAFDGPTFPASQMCGLSTCNTGSVCCNPSCGICTEPGASCSQQPC